MSPIAPLALDDPSTAAAAPTPTPSASQVATSAFGLGFDSLLKIILTQLTYQDPLKPMDNFQFVSQLAQFSQIQIGQSTNDKLDALVSAQSATQATSLLGTKVDANMSSATLSGTVTSIAFDSGAPLVTLKTADGQTVSGIPLGNITQIRKGD